VYARVTTTTLAPDEPDVAGTVLDRILPILRELPGFDGMLLGSELGGRRIVAVSLWASLDALEAAEPVMDKLKRAESAHRRVEAQETVRFRVSRGKLKG
jgi:heme-degrading monooxygenase HmoA